MTHLKERWLRAGLHAGWVAGAWFASAVFVLGADHTGFVAARDPLGHLGALRVPDAWSWNLAGFIVPGVLLLAFAIALEVALHRDRASRTSRIGSGMLMLSALAFVLQGLLPFDLDDAQLRASQLHVSALVLALLGLMAGAWFVAFGLIGRRGWWPLTIGGTGLAAALLVLLIWPAQHLFAGFAARPGHAQRLVFGLYFSWFALAAAVALWRRVRRG